MLSDDPLTERVRTDATSPRPAIVHRAYRPLSEAGGALLETLWGYLEHGRSLEAAARVLYVHPNTVRYRLRKIAELTGWDPLDPREGFVLHTALATGRLDAR